MEKIEHGLLNLPSDTQAEKAILGSILLNSKIMEKVGDILKSHYFYDRQHRVLYEVILSLWMDGKPIDTLMILNSLKSISNGDKLIEEINNDYFVELVSKASLSASGESTANLIKEKYLLRKLIETSDEIKTSAIKENVNTQSLLDLAQKSIFDISLDSIDQEFVPINQILEESFERISTLHANKDQSRGVPTGFTDIDSILGGLNKSDLIILAARPSMGKTSFSLELIKRMALTQKTGVAFFSLEMSRDQLCDKLIASVSGIGLKKIRSGDLSDDQNNNEFMRLGAAIGQLDQAPIWIDDSGSLNILELRTKARRLKSRHNLGVLVIDYLQLMSGVANKNYSGNRVQEVSDISRGLKMLAKELDIPIIALSQLSRSVEGREDKRPMLSDLRESGSIEQDADIVMFVHREEMYHRETKKKGVADIIIAKHRNGETGTVELKWIGHLATFANLDQARVSGYVPG